MVGGTAGTTGSVFCRRCKAKVVSGLKCNICDNYFHNSCAKLSNVKIIDDYSIQCCGEETTLLPDNGSDIPKENFSDYNNQSDNEIEREFYAALQDISNLDTKLDIRIIKYIIHQKDCVIRELHGKINILMDEVNLLKKCNSVDSNNSTKSSKSLEVGNISLNECTVNDDKYCVSSDDINIIGSDSYDADKPISSGLSDNINNNSEDGEANKWVAVVKRNAQKLIINSDHQSHKSQGEKTKTNNSNVQLKRKRQKQVLIGGRNSSEISNIKTVSKKAFLFVTRIDPSTTNDVIQEYIQSSFPEATCEQLNSKFPDIYSSFKVTINAENLDRAFDPSVWPQGDMVTRFFQKRTISKEIT